MIQSVIQLLINDTRVQRLVGRNKANDKYKIYPVLADKDELPMYVVLAIQGNNPTDTKRSVSVMDKVFFDVSTFSLDYPEMDELSLAIRFCIDGFNGISANINIDVNFVTEKDGYDERGYYARIQTYSAFVTRSVNDLGKAT